MILCDGEKDGMRCFAVSYERGIGLNDNFVAGAVGGYGALLAPGVELNGGQDEDED